MRQLILTDNQNRQGFEFIGAAHLTLQAARFPFQLDGDIFFAQTMNQRKRPIARLLADPNNIKIRACGRRTLLHLEEHRQTLDAHRKTDTRNCRPAELLDQPVVAPARGHCALRA